MGEIRTIGGSRLQQSFIALNDATDANECIEGGDGCGDPIVSRRFANRDGTYWARIVSIKACQQVVICVLSVVVIKFWFFITDSDSSRLTSRGGGGCRGADAGAP